MSTMSLASRLLRKLRTAASPRNLVRYVKRVVLLPWNSQKVYDRVVNLHELQVQVHQSVTETLLTFVREVQDRQDMLEQRLTETLRVLTANLREHTVLQAQDLRQVKNRFAELYGALLTDQQKQTQHMADLVRLVDELRQALAKGPARDAESPAQPRIARPGELCPEREVLASVTDVNGRKNLRSAG